MALRMSILVLCPTRGRPRQTAEMAASFLATAELPTTSLLLVVDLDDPEGDGYVDLVAPGVGLVGVEGGSLTAATNQAVCQVWDEADIVGHVGDDHRFVTHGWDRMVTEVLATPGVCYGDDGVWHEELGTAWFASTSIVRKLGWLALPVSMHYGIDDAWIDIGRALHRLTYLPDMHISHPGVPEQKADPDAIFTRAQEHRRADAAAYYRWRDRGGLSADVSRLTTVG
jgi:hypothetical protein